MAKQDFAQVKASTKPESESHSSSLLSAIGIIVIAGLCFSGGYWLGAGDMHQTGNTADVDAVGAKLATQVAENKSLQEKNERLADMVQQWKSKAKEGAHTKVGELSFYKDLPKQSVTPAPVLDPLEDSVKIKPTATTHTMTDTASVSAIDGAVPTVKQADRIYRIQVTSLRTKTAAIVIQRKLKKANFISQIKMADLGEKGQWFRVYTGPYDSLSRAEIARQKIDTQMKLKGFIVRD